MSKPKYKTLSSIDDDYQSTSFDSNLVKLKNRGSSSQNVPDITPKRNNNQIKFLEYKIDHNNDTLNSIALKFKIDVFEIKIHNRIHSDNDFFTKKLLKIPVSKFSSLLHLEDDGVDTDTSTKSGSTPPILRTIRTNDKNIQAIKAKIQNISNDHSNNKNLGCLSQFNILPPSTYNKQMEVPLLDSINSVNARNFISQNSSEQDTSLFSNWKFLICLLISFLLIVPFVWSYMYKEEQDLIYGHNNSTHIEVDTSEIPKK